MTAITVLGAGMMGSALCIPLLDCGHRVHLVGTHLDDEIVDELLRRGHHPTLDHSLPEAIRPHFFSDLDTALAESDDVALGVSSAGVAWAAENLRGRLRPEQHVLMVSKGLVAEDSALVILTDWFESKLSRDGGVAPSAVAITGPCIAGELLRKVPTCTVLSSREPAAATHWQGLLRGDYYVPSLGRDAVGEQVCAALKNAYAMGIAFAQGMHEAHGGRSGSIAMHNVEAAVFAQAVFEMQWIVERLGGDSDVVAGLSGVGDLDVTCNGGRTGRFGKWLGKGVGRTQAIVQMQGATLECLEVLETLRASLLRKRESQRALPLLGHLVEVALDDRPVDLPLATFFG